MAVCPAPIAPDPRLKEWWVENPWLIAPKGKSLSGYERNRIYLNAGQHQFSEVSGITSADSDGDGRSVVAVDIDSDGRQDLIVRQAGGGPVRVFKNLLPQANWLRLTLRGTKSNIRGIGTRVIVTADGRKHVREMFPHNGFKSQGSTSLHFGLGNAKSIESIEILWPSGHTQKLPTPPMNAHLLIPERNIKP